MSNLRKRLEIMASDNETVKQQIDEAAENTEQIIKQKGLAVQAEINKEKYIKLVEAVQNSMLTLSKAWQEEKEFDELDRILSAGYPFQNSFDEVCNSVMDWLEVIKTK